jgi:hypothetical protein
MIETIKFLDDQPNNSLRSSVNIIKFLLKFFQINTFFLSFFLSFFQINTFYTFITS